MDISDNMIIAPGQGFIIKANTAGGIFNFSEGNQTHNNDTFQRGLNNPVIKLWIKDGNIQNYCRIKYIENATTDFDLNYEGELFSGSSNSFAIYSHLVSNSTGVNYQLQSLPQSNYENMIIPIGVNAENGKEITFTIQSSNLPAEIKVFIEDAEKNTFTRLNEQNDEYKVTLTKTLNGIGRFYLHTSLSLDDNFATKNVSICNTDKSTLKITGLEEGTTIVKLFNLSGKEVLNTSFSSNGIKEIKLPKLAKGIYIVKLQTKKGSLNKKITIK